MPAVLSEFEVGFHTETKKLQKVQLTTGIDRFDLWRWSYRSMESTANSSTMTS